MSTVFVECWKCDVCGHKWIKGEIWPETCAKKACRSRRWNKADAPTVMRRYVRKQREPVSSSEPEPVAALNVPVADVSALPVVDRLAIARAAVAAVGTPVGVVLPPEPVAAKPCGFVAYNDVDGEDYRCTLPVHPYPKVKHGGWERV